MCVAAIAWDVHPDWLLVAAGNRDEFHARPAAPLARWPDRSGPDRSGPDKSGRDASGIIAGTDLIGGGTWLGVTEAGRFALVTNYRVPDGTHPGRPSRGKLVTDLLEGKQPGDMPRMNPFNLVLVEHGAAAFLTNHPGVERRPLPAGIHGLSNGGFDVPWPKTLRVGQAIEDWLIVGDPDFEPLMNALRDEKPAPSPVRPDAGRDSRPEPRFAPVFIRDAVYGTRCSTVVAVDRQGRGTIVERSFDALGRHSGEARVEFEWPA